METTTEAPPSKQVEQSIQASREIVKQINTWNTLNVRYKGEEVSEMMNVTPSDDLEEGLMQSQMASQGMADFDDPQMEQLAHNIEGEAQALADLGVIHRFSPEQGAADYDNDPAAAENIRIEGLDDSSEGELLFTSDQLKEELQANLPTSMLKNVDAIQFTPSEIPPFEHLPASASPEDRARHEQAIADRMRHYIYHEVFESAAVNMTLDDMVNWEEALAKDKSDPNVKVSNVSLYTKMAHRMFGAELSNKEDFCDSGAEFIYQPEILKLKAPHRFDAIATFMANRLDPAVREDYIASLNDGVQQRLAERQKTGEDIDELRRASLSHETMNSDEFGKALALYEQRLEGTISAKAEFVLTDKNPQNIRGNVIIRVPPYIKEGGQT